MLGYWILDYHSSPCLPAFCSFAPYMGQFLSCLLAQSCYIVQTVISVLDINRRGGFTKVWTGNNLKFLRALKVLACLSHGDSLWLSYSLLPASSHVLTVPGPLSLLESIFPLKFYLLKVTHFCCFVTQRILTFTLQPLSSNIPWHI